MLIDVSAEGAEEVEASAGGLAALEGEGHFRVGPEGKGPIDHRLDGRVVHHPAIRGLTMSATSA